MGISWPTVIVALASQVVVAWVAVRFGLAQFRQEKWWDRKYDAYAEMLTALHHMRKSIVNEGNMALRDLEPTREQREELDADFKKGSADLAKHTDLGDFLVSPETCAHLRQFGLDVEAASGPDKSYGEYLEGNAAAVERLIEALKSAAKRDLGVERNSRGLSSSWDRRSPTRSSPVGADR